MPSHEGLSLEGVKNHFLFYIIKFDLIYFIHCTAVLQSFFLLQNQLKYKALPVELVRHRIRCRIIYLFCWKPQFELRYFRNSIIHIYWQNKYNTDFSSIFFYFFFLFFFFLDCIWRAFCCRQARWIIIAALRLKGSDQPFF